MLGSSMFRTPQPFELVEFFEVAPCKEEPSDGLWCYETTTIGGARVLFCFNVIERWLKTQIVVEGEIIEDVVHEGATRLWIEQRPGEVVLMGECEVGEGKSRLEIKRHPHFAVNWSILSTSVR